MFYILLKCVVTLNIFFCFNYFSGNLKKKGKMRCKYTCLFSRVNFVICILFLIKRITLVYFQELIL